MKKLLLALLAVTGFNVAQAQSSVTVYGILDVGYIGTNYRGTAGNETGKQNTNAFGNNAETSSRLGFKGVEDLGGGTSAFFTVETGLNPNNATASTFNNRQSFVGLQQKGIGNFAIGTQNTPIHKAVGVTDPGQINNMMGNVIFATTPQANGNSGAGNYTKSTSSSGTSDAYTVRVSNALTVTSDTFAGFTGTGLVVANNVNQTQTDATTGGTTNYNGWGLGVNYEWQKLLLTANYQALKSFQSAATLTSPTPALWTTAGGGTNTQDNQTYIAGTYDFGILKAYAQYINRKVTDTLNTGYYAQRKAEQIGVRGFFATRIEGWVSAGLGQATTFGAGQPTANFNAYQLGSNYWLSKRTNLYAIYGQTQTASVSPNAALAGSNYAVGVRHTF
jgi:predicted porin